ncbi:MAG: hypothetical protein A3H28_07790 [Acidobacteria bacterium RIFCSPLOWO2_02_FULL_61_28]|nr:MAG: hypothetical protein A3H28_07790 [Acidobacteria bacterium RIFCSPLOWO2_02_FULL_61_28]
MPQRHGDAEKIFEFQIPDSEARSQEPEEKQSEPPARLPRGPGPTASRGIPQGGQAYTRAATVSERWF